MKITKFPPPESLSAYVRYFWAANGKAATYSWILFADCRTKLFVSRQGMIRHYAAAGIMESIEKGNLSNLDNKLNIATVRESHSLIVGPSMDYSIMTCHGELDLIGVEFTEVGGHFFLPGDACDYANSSVPVSETTSIFLKHLCCSIRRIACADDCIAALGTLFLSRAKMSFRDILDVNIICNIIACFDKQKEISEIACDNCVSQRQVNRLLRKYVGLSITKVFVVMRFKSAFNDIIRVPSEHLCQITSSDMFYDKAHMVKIFKRCCGQTPGKVRLRLKKTHRDGNCVFLYEEDDNLVYFVY